ncbi:hypothetical protein NDU88_005517 [Pleurodeles waltl]|uniref:Uncharacterized protein n=1 Tax=Pleurodeles waltl TaxID=8319 RepID=A0AAV7WAN3_PLEWA|nr:hypothetical protein NDU88_005517 [Pleurodeles waltl]
MAAESKVQEALRLLREAGRLDILKEGDVVAAVITCSSPRAPDDRQAVRRRGGGRYRGRAGDAVVRGRGRASPPQRAGPLVAPSLRVLVPGSSAVNSLGLGARRLRFSAARVASARAPRGTMRGASRSRRVAALCQDRKRAGSASQLIPCLILPRIKRGGQYMQKDGEINA